MLKIYADMHTTYLPTYLPTYLHTYAYTAGSLRKRAPNEPRHRSAAGRARPLPR